MLTYEEAKALLEEHGSQAAAARAAGVARSTFRDALDRGAGRDVAVQSAASKKLDEQKQVVSRLKAELSDLQDLTARNEELLAYFRAITNKQLDPPKWMRKPMKKRGQERGIVTAFLSDLHLDEVVSAAEVNGLNAYNRSIANLRLKEFFHNLVRLSHDYVGGIKLDGLVLPLGGDMLSGNIHEELRETNEAPILSSMFYWAEVLCGWIEFLLENGFENIYVPCVVGNHGRLDRKPRAKHAVQDNYDWGLYVAMKNYFANRPEVVIDISNAFDLRYEVYTSRYLLTHGDQFKGGSGIAGAMSPLMLGQARKLRRATAVAGWAEYISKQSGSVADHGFDYMLVGHWHQYADFKGIIMNGSTKGYDEYAMRCNFEYEPPRQAFWITDPKHGKTISAPIHCLSDKEDWGV